MRIGPARPDPSESPHQTAIALASAYIDHVADVHHTPPPNAEVALLLRGKTNAELLDIAVILASIAAGASRLLHDGMPDHFPDPASWLRDVGERLI